jgi:peptide/nickel transport system substrate-binding protein
VRRASWLYSPAILLLAAGCGDAGGPRANGVAVYCAASLPDGLDPFVTPDLGALDARLLLFTPLVLYDRDAGVRPYLAESWTWSEDRRTLTFALRGDVQWHDGNPVRAEDVVWTVRAAADEAYGYIARADFASLLDATAPDSLTVVLRFATPYIADVEPFVVLPILPRHVLADVPPDQFTTARFHLEPVGSGPFRYAGRSVDDAIQLDRVAEFPEALGRARLQRIVLRAIPEVSAQLVELETGNVHLCTTGSSAASQVTGIPGARALPIPPVGLHVIPLDMRQAPMNDARVRRALSAALDRGEIVAVLSPLARPARTYLHAAAAQWLDPERLQPDADSAYAVALLDSAGWRTIGEDGIRRNARGEPLRFTLVAPQPLSGLLTVVQSQWRRVGIDVEMQFMEFAAYVDRIRNPDTRPAAMTLSFTPDRVLLPDPFSQLHSTGSSNLASYENAQVDSLVQQLRAVLPDSARGEIYHALQRHVAEDVPMLYLMYVPRLLAVSARVEGVEVDANGPFASASRWQLTGNASR